MIRHVLFLNNLNEEIVSFVLKPTAFKKKVIFISIFSSQHFRTIIIQPILQIQVFKNLNLNSLKTGHWEITFVATK